jgi:Glycoside hydrolase family 44/Bacterial Ig-like domain (group 3)
MRFFRLRSRIMLSVVCSAAIAPAVLAQSSGAPTLSVDVSASRNAISPEIYGIANYGLDATFAQEIKVGNIRWGGDGTTRYNWMVDSSNSGFDWYFIGGNGETTPVPGASPDLMIKTYAPADALITIPILPYVNKSSTYSCSFPVSVYGTQQSIDPYLQVNGGNCGNSISSTGTQLTDTNIYANHIDNTTTLQQQWVQHLVSKFGTAANGGVKFYQLDNEPGGWSNTHRDVMPIEPNYATIVQYGEEYAAAVKQADSTAMILGPSDFTLGGWIGTPSQQNNLYAGQYYLQQMAAYEEAHGIRLLDYFDEHYYFNVSSPAAQLASTRTLWDPTYNGGTWVEQYDFDGPMQLIPRFKSWISTYYPGTKLSISEYSIDSGQKSIVDAIAEMDVLGIFGREQLDFADMWSPPAPTDPIAFSFRMFRNYDGKGSEFGDTSVSAVSSNQGNLSIYAAQRSSDNAVTVLVINKTTSALATSIAFAHWSLPSSAQVYTYSGANLTAIVPAGNAAITNSSLSYSFPSYSAVLFVLQPAAAATTSTTLMASPTAATVGQTVQLTASVSAAGAAVSGGTLTFMDGSTVLGTATVASGSASLSVSTLAAGSHPLSAVYAGTSTDAGSTSATVTLVVSAAASSPPSYTLTLSGNTLKANASSSGTLTLTVTPTVSFSGTLSFACSGLPTGWSCSFAPAVLTGSSTQSTTLTVGATMSANNSTARGLELALVFPLLPLSAARGGRRSRSRAALSLATLAFLALAACGGGSDGSSSTGSSGASGQSSTYTVTVTASGTNLPTHTQQFALTVNS